MSRSNPSETTPNPSRRWFEWAAGAQDGFVRYYDKASQQRLQVNLPFTFLLLDELSTVKGWHDPSESGIYANEVRDTRQDTLTVRAFKGGELAQGLYANIRDRIRAMGGHYQTSCYIAFKNGAELEISNISFKGAALNAWVEFKKANRGGIYKQAVVITGYVDGKKGSTSFRMPTFALKPCSEATQNAGLALDQELQTYLKAYLSIRRDEAAEAAADTHTQVYGRTESAADEELAHEVESREPEFIDDDLESVPF